MLTTITIDTLKTFNKIQQIFFVEYSNEYDIYFSISKINFITIGVSPELLPEFIDSFYLANDYDEEFQELVDYFEEGSFLDILETFNDELEEQFFSKPYDPDYLPDWFNSLLLKAK